MSLPLTHYLPQLEIFGIQVVLSKRVSSVARRSSRINNKNLDFGIHSVVVPESGVEPSKSPSRRSFIMAWPGFSSTVESFSPVDFSRGSDKFPLNL